MLLIKPYFLIAQTVILLLYFVLRSTGNDKKYFIFPSKIHFAVYLASSILVAHFFNLEHQLFCIPVKWAAIVLIVYSVFLVSFLFVEKKSGNLLGQILLGFTLFLSLYIIFFGGLEYLIWCVVNMCIIVVPVYFISQFCNKKYNTRFFDAFLYYGGVLFFPYILITWIFWQARDKKLAQKLSLAILPLVVVIVGLCTTNRINNIIEKLDSSEDKVATANLIIENKVDNYLTELILGAHWKYHTRLLLYDGWRPPFYDPVLAFAQPILYNRKHFHGVLSLPDRKELYQQVFPDKPTSFKCKCAKKERIFGI